MSFAPSSSLKPHTSQAHVLRIYAANLAGKAGRSKLFQDITQRTRKRVNEIIHGDSLAVLREVETNSIDLVCTDPPYGYSFMGKDWDKAVPSVELLQECLRVLKPGAFACQRPARMCSRK